ncbi:hypothetical protein HHL23_18970 [Chryseobacterium sp. RP-3-3]|uniref:Uncharacterized protein n=1 Tax=Chryseobacterium antibioticum TaxID=2728847 RepID=A0A7Y0FT13_9FLAO|nr:hypothetical protein [Chryseobacterium antibioticum]NML71862.1 hypothetical protein [Chryseobacterium antibioticum]
MKEILLDNYKQFTYDIEAFIDDLIRLSQIMQEYKAHFYQIIFLLAKLFAI